MAWWRMWALVFLSTPSAGRATERTAPRVERENHFYPRPPRGGRQVTLTYNAPYLIFLSTPSAGRATLGAPFPPPWARLFLSTPSAGRATTSGFWVSLNLGYFYPRPPRGGRHFVPIDLAFEFAISIHALRGEGDRHQHGVLVAVLISIHALRGEGDSKNGEKHLRFCFIIKRSAQIWKSLSKNIQKNSCDLHRTA